MARLGWVRRNGWSDSWGDSAIVMMGDRCVAATALAGRNGDDAGGVGGDDLLRGSVSLGVCDRAHGSRGVSG